MEDEGAHRERSVALDLGLGVAEGAKEEGEEGVGEGGDAVLHAVDDLGEGSNGGRSVAGGALEVLQIARSISCARVPQRSVKRTHVVLSHGGEESGEELSEIGSEDAGERADEVAGGADEGGIVLGLLSRGNDFSIGIVVDLAGGSALEDLVEVVADGLDVCGIAKARQSGIDKNGGNDNVQLGTMRAGPTTMSAAEKLLQSSLTTSLSSSVSHIEMISGRTAAAS